MKTFHMVEEHSQAPDLDKITIRLMLNPGSKNNSNRGTIKENIKVRKGLNHLKIRCCISCQKTKRILNIREKIFSELENFQEKTTVFQTNTNISLKNLESQIVQLALKDLVPSDTRKDLRECMAMLLRSGKELDERRVEKKDTEEDNYAEIREEFKQHSSKTIEEERTTKIQPK